MKTVEEILAFIHEFEKTTLTSIELETEDLKIKLTKDSPYTHHHIMETNVSAEPEVMHPAACEGLVVKSPLVGTFYEAPSPNDPPFVSVGDIVKKGDTLCIIEAMKTMNEIKAPIGGRILKIHAKNQDFVGFDQALVSIEHDA